jgi:hypothetical protein
VNSISHADPEGRAQPRPEGQRAAATRRLDTTPRTRLLVGTPQSTDGPAGSLHAAMVEMLARARYDGPDAEYTVMNRSLKTATGRSDLGEVSGWRPDITVVNRNGTVDLIEVKSASNSVQELIDKLKAMRAGLPEVNRNKILLFDTDGTPITIPGEPNP